MKLETYLRYVWASKTTLLFGAAALLAGFGFEYAENHTLADAMYLAGIAGVGVPLAVPIVLRNYLEE